MLYFATKITKAFPGIKKSTKTNRDILFMMSVDGSVC